MWLEGKSASLDPSPSSRVVPRGTEWRVRSVLDVGVSLCNEWSKRLRTHEHVLQSLAAVEVRHVVVVQVCLDSEAVPRHESVAHDVMAEADSSRGKHVNTHVRLLERFP
jgi:hypothetical protein